MPPKTAFDYFKEDWKKKQESKGQKFPGGSKDIPKACNDEWRNMTPQQKGPYQTMAKEAKVRGQVHETLYSSQGVPLTYIENEKKRRQDFVNKMNEYIRNTINMAANTDRLQTKRFHLIHVNWYCQKTLQNGTLDSYPAEFAVAEFSLEYGLGNVYHEIINIDLPPGYAYAVAKHSESTHKIPPNPSEAEGDFQVMYDKLLNILQSETVGGEIPPLYTTKSCNDAMPGLLNRMVLASGESVDMFRVYSLETLFLHLQVAAAQVMGLPGFPALAIAEGELQKDYYAYAPDLPCSYHKNLDAAIVHCSMSLVKRWVFTLCNHCCHNLSIEMLPGQHCPINTDCSNFQNFRARVGSLNIGDPGLGTVPSMTGVTEEYRARSSARTRKEEQERRNKSTPLTIIDHSKDSSPAPAPPTCTNNNKPSGYASIAAKSGRSSCPWHTKSYANVGGISSQVPDMDDMNFPVIGGRGASLNKKTHGQQSYVGREERDLPRLK